MAHAPPSGLASMDRIRDAIAMLPEHEQRPYVQCLRGRGSDLGLIACCSGHDRVLDAWLLSGGNPHVVIDGCSLGHAIATRGHVASLRTWMRHGGSVHQRTDDMQTLGHVAAHHGNADFFTAWIQAGGDVHAIDRAGNTIGHVMVCWDSQHRHHRHPCMDAWIRAGGDIHRLNDAGKSIGSRALSSGYRGIFLEWLDAGGCILDGRRTERMISTCATLAVKPHAHARIVTATCLFAMGYRTRPIDPSLRRQAGTDPIGHDLMKRLMMHMQDPVQIGCFAVAMTGHA